MTVIKLKPRDVGNVVLSGTVLGGICGPLGRSSLSFFNPVLANTAGTILGFAGTGAVAAAIGTLPALLVNELINEQAYFSQHPHLKGFIKDTSNVLICLGSLTLATTMLGLPSFGISVLCMMVVPATLYLISTLCQVINASLEAVKKDFPAQENGNEAGLTLLT